MRVVLDGVEKVVWFFSVLARIRASRFTFDCHRNGASFSFISKKNRRRLGSASGNRLQYMSINAMKICFVRKAQNKAVGVKSCADICGRSPTRTRAALSSNSGMRYQPYAQAANGDRLEPGDG